MAEDAARTHPDPRPGAEPPAAGPGGEGFARLARLAARALRTPAAGVTLVEDGQQVMAGEVGIPGPCGGGPHLAGPFCRRVLDAGEALAVADAAGHPLGREAPGVGAYLGAPVVGPGGAALGAVGVVDRGPRAWTADDAAALRDLAAAAAAEVGLRDEVRAHRRAVERLRLLESVVVNANDAILITNAEPIDDPAGPRVVYVNDAFTRMTGYAPEDIIGRTPRILQGPKTDRATLDKIRKALKRWKPVRVELVNNHKDGSEFWVELSIVPVADARGWYTHWVSVQRDVTARKSADADLRLAKDAAEAANRAKSVFLSRMSHELRTPLNAVLGFGQLLELDDLNADQRDSAGQIRKAGRHLLNLINEVLDISRVEAGDLSPAVEEVDAGAAAAEAMALVGPLAAQAGVLLDPAPAAGVMVLADRQRLKQVFLNLLSNAVKYNRPGGRAGVACGAAPDGRARVTVTDTGWGIPADVLHRAFTPFDRLGAERGSVEGTGLGLALSRRLVEAMGGAMGLDSEPGRGSAFWVDLPRAAPAGANKPDSRLLAPAPASPVRGTVLYVEDNLSNLKLVERIMRRRPGVRLLSALQGGVGWDLARQHRPDLIVLDLHLPDVDGGQVLEWVRADAATRDIPVVVLSADATQGRIDRLLAAGARQYLTKPLDVPEFLRVLDDALEPAARRAP